VNALQLQAFANSISSPIENQKLLIPTEEPQPRQRVLVVEDDHRSAMLLQEYLQVLGYEVEHLANGKGFVEKVRSFNPKLILLDVQLSDKVTGLDLLATLRSQADLQNKPVVFCTAAAMTGDRERFLAAGANDYLSKPINLIQLKEVVVRYLQSSVARSCQQQM
jgi:CheY-like chemotaxis protein